MTTEMQSDFKLEMIKPLIKILYPEFEDIVDEFKVTFSFKYTWVNITAVKPPHYCGIDNRTKKERLNGVKDPRELIEEGYRLNFGIDNHNHNQHNNLIWGPVKKERMKELFHCVGFHVWKFAIGYNYNKKFTKEQEQKAIEFLMEAGLKKCTLNEFYNNYYKD